jgi:two-component system cell cycle response regulator DivK
MTNASIAVPRRWPARPARPPVIRGAGQGAPTVVVADSHEDCRALYAMVLRHAGFDVLEAETGEEAIRLAFARRPVAVVMAAVMRGVNGFRALEVLKDHADTEAIPVLVVSSVCGDGHEQRARAAGCSAYLMKPCPPRCLLAEVRRCTAAPHSG